MNLSDAFDQSLPIDRSRDDVESALESDAPLVVTAPTGSGKSTRLPLWLADRVSGTVLVVEPRRVACRSLSGYLSQALDESPGQTIGHRVRFDDRTGGDTRIIFATTGVVLQMLSDGTDDFDALIIDEFHERGWEVDLITAIMLDLKASGDFNAPLILTSATVDAQGIADDIGAQKVISEGRTYPVDITYQGEAKAPTSDDLASRVRKAVDKALSDDDGDILVFLPGKGEISDCQSTLRSLSQDVEILPVHGRLPPGKMSHALRDKASRRRIFLATNVAETSLTLPGVTTVIDSGLVRMRVHRGSRSALALVPIAKDSADQRAGRAGRVRPGQCIRLWSQRFNPDEATRPAIERVELDDVVLRAARCGLQGQRFDDAPWLSQPPAFAIDKARKRLRRMGALDEDHHLTERGRRMGALPVNGDEARILLDPPDSLAATAADLVALLQMGRDLLLPHHHLGGRNKETIKRARTKLLKGTGDEVTVQLRCLRGGDAHRHGLHRSRLSEARRIADSLRARLNVTPTDPTADSTPLPPPEKLADYLLKRIPESAFVARQRALKYRHEGRAKRGRSEPWANGDIELSIWPFDPPVISDKSPPRDPVAGLILDHFWLGDGGIGIRGTGRLLLPCSYNQLLDAGIGTPTVTRTKAGTRHGRPYLRGIIAYEHAGVTLDTRESDLEGDVLHQAAAEAILEGRLLDDAGERLLQDLHLWDLLARWPKRDRDRTWQQGPDAPEPKTYLADRLAELGVAAAEDLMLVEAQDLRPDLVDLFGIYQYQLDELSEDFPRVWTHMGKRYQCDVNPARRRVLLTPLDKKTARADDPKERYIPRFRGFDVTYQNASRKVPIRRR